MLKVDHDGEAFDVVSGSSFAEEQLTAENVSLRLLLTQARLSAETLLEQAGIDAKAREAADRLQKLILEELHHRIKNTLATVGAIASQSLRNARAYRLHRRRSKAGCWRSAGRTICCCRRDGPARTCERSSWRHRAVR